MVINNSALFVSAQYLRKESEKLSVGSCRKPVGLVCNRRDKNCENCYIRAHRNGMTMSSQREHLAFLRVRNLLHSRYSQSCSYTNTNTNTNTRNTHIHPPTHPPTHTHTERERARAWDLNTK